MKNKLTLFPKYKLYLRVLIVVISLLIAAGGYLFYQHQADALRREKYNELKAIADLKESQIENWLHERNADAKVVAQSPFFSDGINRWLQDTGNVQLKEDIIERLKPAQKEFGYENIFLAKTNGDLLLSATDSLVEINAFLKQKITETSVKREIVFTDFYLGQKENKIYFDIIAPIINSKNETVAVLIFRRDPNDFLYPLIQTWPTPGKSAETVILRVENDSVVFLNELRHRENTALKLKIPLTRTEVPAVQAALGRSGLFEGIDYRGVEVLSDIRIIPGANWILLSKVDKSEIYAGLNKLAGIINGFTILLIMICAIGFAFIYNLRKKTIYRELYSKEKELREQQEKFKVTMDSLGEGIITLDINGKVQYMNKLAEEMTGWKQREARGSELHDIYPVKNEETGQRENNILEKIYKQGIVKELANHTLLISKSGKEIPVMDTGAPIYDNDGTITGIVIAFQDETEKRKQRKIIEQSEVRLRSTLDNMMEGCQIISHDYSFLFINKAAEKHNRRPNAEFLGKNYMQMWPGIEATEVFHRIKETMEKRVYHHFENEFVFPDGTRGWFELHIQPVPEGIFILSQDVTNRMIASRKLEEAHRRLQLASAAGKVALWNWDFANNTLEWTSLVDGMLGYDAGEFPRTINAWGKIIHPDDFKDVDSLLNEHLEKKIPYEIEYRVFKKDGSLAWWHDSGIAECNSDGKPVAMSGTVHDITKRKLTEEALWASDALFQSAINILPMGLWIFDAQGKIVSSSAAAQRIWAGVRYVDVDQLGEYKGWRTDSGKLIEAHEWAGARALEKGETSIEEEVEIECFDGTHKFILDTAVPLRKSDGSIGGAITMNQDITGRKLAEKEILQNAKHIERLNRLLTMLSNVNQLIVREKDDLKVLEEACRIAVDDGKFELAWIAVPEENKSISVKVKSGRHDNYLGQLVLNMDAEENDKGITVYALTEKQHIICNDIEHDIVMQRYKDDALGCGFKSCASFPILVFGKLFGAISLYSDFTNYFKADEIKLLDETALDIGFAIETNVIEREKYLAEEQLRESNERFNRLVSNLNDVVWTASIDGSEILDINDSFESIYGISLEEFKKHPNLWMDAVHPHDRAIAKASGKELFEEGKSQIEYRIVRPDGNIVWLLDRKSLIYDSNGKAVQMGGIAKDITERKLAEDEIKNLNASLKIKIEERTRQLAQAKTEADRANLAKSEFLSRMSHELRTPMNSILGFAQLLNRSETNPESTKRIKQIMDSGKHLLDLINEVLDLARIESGRISLSLEPVQLSGIITETLDIVHPIVEERDIKIELADSPFNNLFVKSDRQKLKQVMINLINNAVKYNRKGGSVRVEVGRPKTEVGSQKTEVGSQKSVAGLETEDRKPKTIRISVSDTGIGIAANEQHKLFEPFQRIGAEISEVEGTGLGLAVAKKLVDAMSGSIGVESAVGVGSTFWVELPQTESHLERNGQTRNRSIIANGDNTRGGTILYIEDDISNIQLVEDILQTERPKFRLLTEMYGKNAVKMATDYNPGLILLDLDLPDIHGSKVLKLLQTEPATKSIPVVVLSGDATTKRITRLLAAGARHYLIKPLDVDKFLMVVDELMNKG